MPPSSGTHHHIPSNCKFELSYKVNYTPLPATHNICMMANGFHIKRKLPSNKLRLIRNHRRSPEQQIFYRDTITFPIVLTPKPESLIFVTEAAFSTYFM